MQCAKCYFENPPDAKFCGKCGETLKSSAPPLPDAGVSQELKIGILIGSVFLPLVGIIMGAIYLNDPNPDKKKVGRLWLYAGLGIFALECLCGFIVGLMMSSQNRYYSY